MFGQALKVDKKWKLELKLNNALDANTYVLNFLRSNIVRPGTQH